ncbi:hypothetical protein DFH08DRAFT_938365 [Mycena albidolilacea]|uniref:Uncharacterized protein n=1 Tax=Mycena albidolilacea TaxID=1033008 RepID=A0AAD7EN05_9AGAR|nr:hypothetical protein DFH08DRAFT_938365 [Mycena albidolilacea]
MISSTAHSDNRLGQRRAFALHRSCERDGWKWWSSRRYKFRRPSTVGPTESLADKGNRRTVPSSAISPALRVSRCTTLASYQPKESDPDEEKKMGYVPMWLDDADALGIMRGIVRLDVASSATDIFQDTHYKSYAPANNVFAQAIAEGDGDGDEGEGDGDEHEHKLESCACARSPPAIRAQMTMIELRVEHGQRTHGGGDGGDEGDRDGDGLEAGVRSTPSCVEARNATHAINRETRPRLASSPHARDPTAPATLRWIVEILKLSQYSSCHTANQCKFFRWFVNRSKLLALGLTADGLYEMGLAQLSPRQEKVLADAACIWLGGWGAGLGAHLPDVDMDEQMGVMAMDGL